MIMVNVVAPEYAAVTHASHKTYKHNEMNVINYMPFNMPPNR